MRPPTGRLLVIWCSFVSRFPRTTSVQAPACCPEKARMICLHPIRDSYPPPMPTAQAVPERFRAVVTTVAEMTAAADLTAPRAHRMPSRRARV